MVNVNMSWEQLELLSEHLQGNETRESEAVVSKFIDEAVAACKDEEDINSNIYL
jgi:hypothetical protein